MLSHGAWTRFYGGDPGMVGRELRTARAVYTIVGVAQQGFDGTVEDDIVEFFIAIQHYEPRDPQDRSHEPGLVGVRATRAGPDDGGCRGAGSGTSAPALARERTAIYGRWRDAGRGDG